jgi:hypothetical protein
MCAKQWNSIVAKGNNALENADTRLAIYYYTKSMSEGERMINNTILNFDGDTDMLGLYTKSCKLLVGACKKANKKKDAIICINEAMSKLSEVIKNPGYPILMRGKSIRAFEELFTIVKESETVEAINVIEHKLHELSFYIKQMLPVERDIQRN